MSAQPGGTAPGQAAPAERVLAAVAVVLFESDEPAEDRAERAVEILERSGVRYQGEMAVRPAKGSTESLAAAIYIEDAPPRELLRLLRLIDLGNAGRVNYDGYRQSAGGVSLVSGAQLPEYDDQPGELKRAWQAGAEWVVALLADNLTALAAETAAAQPASGDGVELRIARRTADELLAELTELREQLAAWPTCPDGCGCRLGTEDADARDCACDGPCCMECREMGYPDAPSYRDLPRAEAVAPAAAPGNRPGEALAAPGLREAMAETRQLRTALRTLATLWDATSDKDEETAQRPNRPRLVLEERATTRRACAADIRKLAGPESQ